ncbi:hypothetical protein [uncultured Dokdonia sp.]|uniref:hypothetical protein n=1 Tax=uncultured Dokdonia sp. TaxID=575653 RepID=UPI0026020E91|nr:hypothetical protein [uncultured Dokdonia sp.]
MKISFKNVQNELSREELKSLSGGRATMHGTARCCWIAHPSSCSVCVPDHEHYCEEGAKLEHC